MTLLVVQTILPAMSHLRQVHTINTKTLQFGTQDSSHVPVWCPGHLSNLLSPSWQKSEFHFSFYVFLFSSPPTTLPSSHGLLLHSCPRSRLSNYQSLACRLVTLDWVISTDCFLWERWVTNLQGPAQTSLKTTQSADAPLSTFAQLVLEQSFLSHTSFHSRIPTTSGKNNTDNMSKHAHCLYQPCSRCFGWLRRVHDSS